MDLEKLRERLYAVDYTVDGVQRRLGPVAHTALDRNETTPGLRATVRPDPLGTLIRLFLLQTPVPYAQAEQALPELVEPLCEAELLHLAGDTVRALVDIRPYGSDTARTDLWVVADLTPGMDGATPAVAGDHVLGVNAAALTLAQLTVRRPALRALDLGTGCGVQSLHLAGHASHIVATDVNPRALWMAGLTTTLNDPNELSELDDPPDRVTIEVREGSLFAPVANERFDLIVSNPPFVISPRGELTYRETGLPGDELSRQVVAEGAEMLAPGGTFQLLANWLHVAGRDWRQRLRGWFERTGCDVWVVQREVADPAEYVETWLKDAGWHGQAGYRERYAEWLDWLHGQGVEGVGFGWITMRRTDAARPTVRIEDWPHRVVQPLGPEVERWLDVVQWLRATDDDGLADTRLLVADDVHTEQIGQPGAEDPSVLMLRQRGAMCRSRTVDTALGGLVGACDGELTIGQIADALARLLLDQKPDAPDALALRARLLAETRSLLEEGYLHLVPADPWP